MKLVTKSDDIVVVELSRRNIEGLLQQAEDYEGGRDMPQIMKRTEQGLLIVTMDEDAPHYNGRRAGSSGPGQVYGETVGP